MSEESDVDAGSIPQAEPSDPRATGDWFVVRPGWRYQESEMVRRIARLSEARVYYGEVKAPNSWRRRATQKYEDKDNCLVIGVDEATARAVAAVWVHASQKRDRAKDRFYKEEREINAHRDAKIAAILADSARGRNAGGETETVPASTQKSDLP